MMRTVRRALAIAGAVVVVWALVPVSAHASGGGGCGRRVTARAGTSVRIYQFCFTPTVLKAPVGARVTFTNADPLLHTVLGANGAWGSFEELGIEQSRTYRFGHAGVYSYVCTVHPGMSGAIVIGNPTAAPATASVIPVAEPSPEPVVPLTVAAVSKPDPASNRVWILGIGLSMLAAPLAWAVGRGQRSSSSPPGS